MDKRIVTAIVLSAGSGKRMGGKVAKQYMLMNEKPVIYYALKAFEDSFVDRIILVTAKDDIEYCKKEIVDQYHFQKVNAVIAGGAERYHSVYQGILAASPSDYIFIHDGARPFVDQATLFRNMEEVVKTRACVTGMPVKDTIKEAGNDGCVSKTLKREDLWQIQTPQTFEYNLIREAYTKFLEQEEETLASGVFVTDDAMVVEYFMHTPVKLVEGSYKNIKITTPEDLLLGEMYAKQM